MLRPAATCRRFLATSRWVLCFLAAVVTPLAAHAYGPRGFDTVIIDAGHGGFDRGGGPGQAIPEKPYTLDAAIRLQRELARRGFRTVMTRTSDVFVSLPTRVAIANSFRNAIFVSVHYNSAPRSDAHGYETYFYRSDSFGLATRLHRAQLATLNTEDRHVRRRGFYVVRNPRIPAVLCEGGFLTNPAESRMVTDVRYRQRWAENIASAILAQRREGDPYEVSSYQPPVVSQPVVVSRGGGRHSRGHARGSTRGSSSRHRTSSGSSHHASSGSRHHASSSSSSHRSTHSSATKNRRHHR